MVDKHFSLHFSTTDYFCHI